MCIEQVSCGELNESAAFNSCCGQTISFGYCTRDRRWYFYDQPLLISLTLLICQQNFSNKHTLHLQETSLILAQWLEKRSHNYFPGRPERGLWTGQPKRMFVEYVCIYKIRKWILRNKVLMFTIHKDIYIGSYHTMVSTAHSLLYCKL